MRRRGRAGLRDALRRMLREKKQKRNLPGFGNGGGFDQHPELPPTVGAGGAAPPPPPPLPPAAPSSSQTGTGAAFGATGARRQQPDGTGAGVGVSSFPAHLNPIFSGYQFLERGECRPAPDGRRMFFCPTPSAVDGAHRCVRTDQVRESTNILISNFSATQFIFASLLYMY